MFNSSCSNLVGIIGEIYQITGSLGRAGWGRVSRKIKLGLAFGKGLKIDLKLQTIYDVYTKDERSYPDDSYGYYGSPLCPVFSAEAFVRMTNSIPPFLFLHSFI